MKYVLISALFLTLFIGGCATQDKYEGMSQIDKIIAQNEDLKQQSVEQMWTSRQIPFVMFEFDSTKIPTDYYETLDKVGEILTNKKIKLSVEGNADMVSSNKYNDWLSNKRTAAIKSYLVSKGVHPDSIQTYGNGKRKPLVNYNTVEARQLNRRVDLSFSKRHWNSVF
ncbi:MAG: OmpA family protein [Elusimicrobiaceae bacterium]|jgi:outer membrane protein OmpA-like peptidoglycan-associated protein|nr:OmpA family protein [Elusimicrobiaceae bacterium]MBT5987871.1 OmpA family protein [Elusimicrobiaceae bacterium]MBT6715478.1 OmpA family protein [Elusimicrobiaceae bacterium]